MRDNGLFAWLRSLQEYLPRNRRQFRIIQRLNEQRGNAVEREQPARKRRVVAMNVVQITEAELGGANHQGKRAQPVVFYSDLYHLLGVVVDGIQNQRAKTLVALGLAQCRVSPEVITPESKACGIQIVARSKYVHALAQFVGLTIAQRRNSGVGAVGSKIKNEHVVLVVL